MQISEVWRYPVKSMVGERVDRTVLTPEGVAGDRAYAVIDRSDGKVASAKNPRKWRALLDCSARFADEPRGGEAPVVHITLPDRTTIASDDPQVDVVLSRVFGRDVTLATAVPPQATFEETWPDVEGMAPADFVERTQVRVDDGESVSDLPLALAAPGSFFDLASVHLVTTAAMAELERLAPSSRFVSARFRPNFVIDGAPSGFGENGWVGSTVRLGADASVNIMMPTMRCVMTTLAQRDLPEDRAVLRTAATHNRVEIAGLGEWACVGSYASVVTEGNIAVGDVVEI